MEQLWIHLDACSSILLYLLRTTQKPPVQIMVKIRHRVTLQNTKPLVSLTCVILGFTVNPHRSPMNTNFKVCGHIIQEVYMLQ